MAPLSSSASAAHDFTATDNLYPWNFESEELHLKISPAQTPDHAAPDYLSLGTIITNIQLEAKFQGFNCKINYPSNTGQTSIEFSPVSISENKPSADLLYHSIFRQHAGPKLKGSVTDLAEFQIKLKLIKLAPSLSFSFHATNCTGVISGDRNSLSLTCAGELKQKIWLLAQSYNLLFEEQGVAESGASAQVQAQETLVSFQIKKPKCKSKTNNTYVDIYKIWAKKNKSPEKFDYVEAFSRNIGILSRQDQMKLKNATIAIPGMGGVGGIHLMTLSRLGIGGFHIADGDVFEQANFNRQYGATMSRLGQEKVDVMEQLAKDINPDSRIKKWNEFITEKNVEEFLCGCDLVVDSLDAFCLEARRTVLATAKRMNIPVVTAGPIGFSCSMLVFTPDGVSFDEHIDYKKDAPESENFLRFMLGLVPRPYFVKYMQSETVSTENKKGPSVGSSVTLCAGFAAVEATKILLNRGKVYAVPRYHYYDPYLGIFKIGYVPVGNKNFIQRLLLNFLLKKYAK